MTIWSTKHRAFVVEAFFKNIDSFVKAQRLFWSPFNVGRHHRIFLVAKQLKTECLFIYAGTTQKKT